MWPLLPTVLLITVMPSFTAPTAAENGAGKPLPQIADLLRSVEAHQRELDKVRENYTFHETQVLTTYDKKGTLKKTETKESYDFFVQGHLIQKVIRKDGKPLSADEAKKEEERATKEAVKYAQPGAEKADKDDISVSRLLEIISFSNPRRVAENGRDVIAVDFTGDPQAKAHGRSENAVKRVSGTVWIDEEAREVTRMDVALNDNFRLGFGLLATVDRGSTFSFQQGLIRNEVWLPTSVDGRFDGKAALFVGFHVQLQLRYDDYRRFGASATESPGATPVVQTH